jgi:hypothetical protein
LFEDNTPCAPADRSIGDPHNASDVTDGNRIAEACRKRRVSVTLVFIQSQLRGIRRFGYRVSKENFLFFALDIPSMSNTGGCEVFRCAQRRFPRPRAAEKAQRFNGLVGMRRSVALHKDFR